MFEWLGNEGWIVLSWWALATLAGAAALPLCMRLLGSLPDRGYTLARAAGILLTSFVFWLLATLGFLRNETGSIILAWFIVLTVGLLVYFEVGKRNRRRISISYWWNENRRMIIVFEVLFIVLLMSWSLVRAHQNNLVTTEKPMDLALMASIQRTETFPPPDPWLSGYSISYYYFGYVIAASFSQMSGVESAIGYNLWTAMLFALAGTTAFGVVYNLVRAHQRETVGGKSSRWKAIITGLLGTYMLVMMGNYLTPLVDIEYFRGGASEAYLDLWDVRERETPRPAELGTNSVDNWDYWWWFRSARIIHDRNLPGMGAANEEAINEFPMFSFVLADNHPHVMALPFAVLALGLALNTALSPRRPTWEQFIFYGLIAGSFVFLNTWDAPTYMGLIVVAEGMRRWLKQGRITGGDWAFLLYFLAVMGGITLIAYFPFLVGFRSQLGGALPNIIHPTHFGQYFLVFGALVPFAAMFIAVETWRGRRAGSFNRALAIQIPLGILLLFVMILIVFIAVGMINPEARNAALRFVTDAGGWSAVLPQIISKRVANGLTTLVLLIGIGLIAGRLFNRHGEKQAYPATTGLALVFIAAGLLVTLAPEFVYLRDNFATRMNTIFKFYYQAWTLFAIGGAFGLYTLLNDARTDQPPIETRPLIILGRLVLIIIMIVALMLGAIYPMYAIHSRALIETGIIDNPNATLTLNGGRTLTNPGDYEALVCLREIIGREDVVVAEVSHSGSYDYFAGGIASGRLAGITGAPTVLGWQGHQSQWRGTGYSAAVGTRADDIRRLYSDLRIDMVQDVIQQYGIDYILYGSAERDRYGAAGEQKFFDIYPVVCESDTARIFRVEPLTNFGN